MASDPDWRLDFCKRLKGERFERKTYQPSPGTDHDHCAACWKKFAEWQGPEIAHEGYATVSGANHAWLCPDCFADLREIMSWTPAE